MAQLMKPIIITVASPKGGCGKSTTTILLAGTIAAKGLSCHIIDLDQNRSVYRWHTSHKAPVDNVTVSTVDANDFTNHLKEVVQYSSPPDFVINDVAGSHDKAMIAAMVRSHIVIVPSQPSEPDLNEAIRAIKDLKDLGEGIRRDIPYRLLLTSFEPLDPQYQRHIVEEIARHKLKRFDTVLTKRAAYREIFLTGKIPQQLNPNRGGVGKAIAELEQLYAEFLSLIKPMSVKEAA